MGYLNTLIQTSGSQLQAFYQFTDTPYIDPSDKLNWQVTVNLLIVLVLVLTNISEFVNKKISCAVPIYFSENQEEYANHICYVTENKYAANESNTILVAANQSLVYFKKSNVKENPTQLGSYYVWLPYLILALILSFLLVKCLWIYLLSSRFQDLDLNELLKSAVRLKDFPVDKFVYFDSASQIGINQLLFRNNNIDYLISNLNRVVQSNLEREYDLKTACKTYISIKLVNIFVIVGQTLLINQLLGIDIYSFSYRKLILYVHYVKKHFEPTDGLEYYQVDSAYFPLKTVCVFQIRELASTNSYAVVCSLPINLFIQFSFFILSIWYLVLVVFNLVYLAKWWLLFKRRNQIEFIKGQLINRLRMISKRSRQPKSCSGLSHLGSMKCAKCDFLFAVFFDSFLSSDFVFLLRIISLSSSRLLIENILVVLWKIFSDHIQLTKNGISRF